MSGSGVAAGRAISAPTVTWAASLPLKTQRIVFCQPRACLKSSPDFGKKSLSAVITNRSGLLATLIGTSNSLMSHSEIPDK